MKKKIVTIMGVCLFCGKESEVIAKVTSGHEVMDPENYVIAEHPHYHNGEICAGTNKMPDAIAIKFVS